MTQAEDRQSRRLRILVVNWLDRENPRAGGAEEHLHQIFGRLASKGHHVTALVSGWKGCASRATLDGIQVHRAGRRNTFSGSGPRYYRRHLARGGFDVVVEDLNKVPLFCRYWVDAPVVLLAHHLFGSTSFQAGPFPIALATWLLERPIPSVFRSTPVVAVSESTRQDLIERGLDSDLIHVIPNGISVDDYSLDSAPVEAARPTLLFVGRLKKYKRVDLVIAAVAKLVEAGRDVEFLVAGAGDQLASLQADAVRRGLRDRVRFLGFVSEERKVELLHQAWVHVLTSSKEGWGISNLEAAACGTPTVASDAPGLRESVVDGVTGILVPHGDLPELTKALLRLLTNEEMRHEMGRKARAFAEGFSWETSADEFDALLRRVVADRGPE